MNNRVQRFYMYMSNRIERILRTTIDICTHSHKPCRMWDPLTSSKQVRCKTVHGCKDLVNSTRNVRVKSCQEMVLSLLLTQRLIRKLNPFWRFMWWRHLSRTIMYLEPMIQQVLILACSCKSLCLLMEQSMCLQTEECWQQFPSMYQGCWDTSVSWTMGYWDSAKRDVLRGVLMFTRQEACTSEQLITYPGSVPQSVWSSLRWWTSQRFRLW